MNRFAEKLKEGIVGESYIANWFRNKGYNVLPVYEKEIDEGKGPRLFAPCKQIIAPDMLVFKEEKCYWIEAKHKNAFTLHRISQKFVTGIDILHYEHYLEIDKKTPWPVWLFFLHKGGQAKNSPPSPSGLYGNSIRYLSAHEHHRHDNWGKHGMVYWSEDVLTLLEKYEEV